MSGRLDRCARATPSTGRVAGRIGVRSPARGRTPSRPARLAALALAAVLAAGATSPASAAERWFAVELIVFDDLEGDGVHAEVWPPDPGEPPVDDAVELASSPEGGPAFRLTPRSELRLRDTWGALRRSSRYRPLLHVGWQLPGLARKAARWAHIEPHLGESRGGALVRGAVRVSLARFLHVELDLLYDRPRGEPADGPGDAAQTRFRLRSNRRMRSKELHYIDHPVFGVLVLITRAQP